MNTGRAREAVINLLLTGLLLWNTAVQAFSFCSSTGKNGWGSASPNYPYYQSPNGLLPPSMPVMPFSYTPHPGSYYYRESQTALEPVAPMENQGLDYIMR